MKTKRPPSRSWLICTPVKGWERFFLILWNEGRQRVICSSSEPTHIEVSAEVRLQDEKHPRPLGVPVTFECTVTFLVNRDREIDCLDLRK